MRGFAWLIASGTLFASIAAPAVRAQDVGTPPPAAGETAAPGDARDGAGSGAAVADSTAPEPTAAELADAHHSFEVASTAYESGDYETAADEFRAAYEVTRHPELLFNVYLAEERAGRPAEAADALGRYLELATAITAEERPLLERRLERLRARAASRTTTPPPVEELDGSALLASPIESTPEGTPLPDDGGGSGAGATPGATGGGPPAAGIALLVTGGVLLLSFAVLAPLSEVEDQRLAGRCGRDAGHVCRNDETTTLMALNLASDVSWIGATVAGMVGLVLVLTLPAEGGASADSIGRVAIAPSVSPGSVGVTAGGTF